MINMEQTFTPRVNPADANYPFGSIKDNTSPGANDGTPLAAVWGNDWEGFAQAAMTEAGITPSGLPDTAQDSQLLDAVKAVTSGALRNELNGDGGSGMLGFSHSIGYAAATAGHRLANSVYTTDTPFLAKCDGVTDDSAAIQAAIDYAASVGKPCVQPGISYIGSQIIAKGTLIGFGSGVSGFVSNEPIYALKTSFNPATKRISGLSIKSTATTQASCNLRGLDTTGEVAHFSVIEDIAFERLLQAIKIDPYFYSNTFRNITCHKCGTATQWAIEYVDSSRGDGANNILWDGLSVTSDSTWLARGIKISDAWGTTINHIHLENLGDYAAEFGGRSISINGGYIEQHETLGTGIFTSNKVKNLSTSIKFNSVLINAKIETENLGSGGTYNGCVFNDGGFVPVGSQLYDTTIIGNRVSVILPFYDLSSLISVSRGSPVNIPFISKDGTLRVNGNFSSVPEQVWPEGGLGELRFNGGDIALATASDYALHNSSALQLKPVGSTQCGVRWTFPSRFRQGLGQATVNKLSAWAMVKVVSASGNLQLSFGLGGSQFESSEKLVDTGNGGAAQWALLIVDDVAPYSDYVTFNLNRVGGGVPPVGIDEFAMIDSFGVCANGIDYRNLFGSDNL